MSLKKDKKILYVGVLTECEKRELRCDSQISYDRDSKWQPTAATPDIKVPQFPPTQTSVKPTLRLLMTVKNSSHRCCHRYAFSALLIWMVSNILIPLLEGCLSEFHSPKEELPLSTRETVQSQEEVNIHFKDFYV